MFTDIFIGIMLPLVGTSFGSACVFVMKGKLNSFVQCALNGFAAGVMTAASVWSLLIPSINRSEGFGRLSFLPAVIGFWLGIAFLFGLDRLVPHLHIYSGRTEGPKSNIQRTTMLVLAVALHNLPEGMAVGAVYSALLAGEDISLSSAFALSLGIAVQNFPEGAIISMPLKANGFKKFRSFVYGVLSGVVEPAGALLTIVLSFLIVPVLPLFLSFAAGAMIYVVVEELIPAMSCEKQSDVGTLFFSLGFSLMMALDVALG